MPRRPRLSRTLLSVALLGLAACEREPDPWITPAAGVEPAAGRVLNLKLTPPSPRSLPGPRVVKSIRVGEEVPPDWKVRGENPSIVHGTGPAGPWTGLEFESTRIGSLEIPGSFPADEFREVVLTLAVKGLVDVGVKLKRNRRVVITTPLVRVRGDGKPMPVGVELPKIGLEREPFDSIVIYYKRIRKEPVFLGLDFVWSARARALPAPASGPAPVDIGGEVRSAVGLSSLAPLITEFEADPGLALALGYGRPASVRGWGERTTLKVRLTRGGEILQEHVFRMGVEDERWHDVQLSLAKLTAGPVQLEFHLDGRRAREKATEVLCALAGPQLVHRTLEPRTVVLVTSDTHRADHLNVGRNSVDVATPFLDGLAARGVLFEDCFASTNITIPSHVALLTGISPRDTGIVDNITALADKANTLAERFRAGGFTTLALVSVRHLRHAQSGLGQGFDRMLAPESDASIDSEIAVDQLLESLPALEGRSLFLWLHVFDAHAPYAVPKKFERLYYAADRDPYDESLPDLQGKARPMWDKQLRDPDWPLSQYKAEVTYLDSQIERALSHPRFETAVIAITADHGESLGGHGIYYEHHGLFPDTLAVPLILAGPGVPRGVRVDSSVRQLDLGRTLLDLAGLGGALFPGENLLRWTETEQRASPEPRFAMSSHGSAASMELDGWFLALRLNASVSPKRAVDQVELYYLPDDRDCETDLVESHHDRAREMRALLIEWLAEPRLTGMLRASAVGAGDLAQLAELGYAGGEAPAPVDRPWYQPKARSEWVRRFE